MDTNSRASGVRGQILEISISFTRGTRSLRKERSTTQPGAVFALEMLGLAVRLMVPRRGMCEKAELGDPEVPEKALELLTPSPSLP